MSDSQRLIGRSILRVEDPPLVAGRGRYADDISFPHQLHMRVVRSSRAHGRILSIDAEAARAMPGVVAVWTAADIPEIPSIGFREGRIEHLEVFRQPVLAVDYVRYVGEPIAAIFSEDPYVAEDAAETVVVDIDELPVIVDAAAPVGEFAPGVSTEASILRQSYGDLTAQFAKAHKVIELDLKVGRHSGVPLETRGALGRYDVARDVLELHGAAKVLHKNREALAQMFGRPLSGVHLYESNVGGGFGVRGELYPEDALVCAAAMRLNRPIKWIEDRREHLMAASHSRQQHHHIKAAIDDQGRLLALDDEFYLDQGAYLRTHAVRVADMSCGVLPGPYRFPAYRVAAKVRMTNKTPAATYRAPGRYETTFVRERLMDAIAEATGLDLAEVRRRNALTSVDMPYESGVSALGLHVSFDTGDYVELLEGALAQANWNELQADAARRRAAGEMVGVGLAMFVEESGIGPRDGVQVTVEPTGTIEVVTGGSNVGQGFDTVMTQICADTLGADYRKVRIVRGRTDRIEYGIGAHASRATVMTGNATYVASQKVREKALAVAAEFLQTPAEELDVVDGEVVRKGDISGPSMSLAKIAQSLSPTSKTLGSHEPSLSAFGWFASSHLVHPYGVHVALVSVERGTGAVTIERYVAAFDVGRAINPMLVRGQIVGGFAQGLGGALFEEFLYSADGEPLSVSLADYLVPSMTDTPTIETMLCENYPSDRNPLGIKGAGEAGITGVGAAVASAIDQAIGMPGAVTQLPVTPQRLREILRNGAAVVSR